MSTFAAAMAYKMSIKEQPARPAVTIIKQPEHHATTCTLAKLGQCCCCPLLPLSPRAPSVYCCHSAWLSQFGTGAWARAEPMSWQGLPLYTVASVRTVENFKQCFQLPSGCSPLLLRVVASFAGLALQALFHLAVNAESAP